MRYMLSYDISKPKKRYEVVKILVEFGCNRVQKSVYFGEFNEAELSTLRLKLKAFFRNESLVIIPLEKDMLRKSIFLCKLPSMREKGDIFI